PCRSDGGGMRSRGRIPALVLARKGAHFSCRPPWPLASWPHPRSGPPEKGRLIMPRSKCLAPLKLRESKELTSQSHVGAYKPCQRSRLAFGEMQEFIME